MVRWVFFDVGSTLVDETAAYDHRVWDMISGTNIIFEELNNARIAFTKSFFRKLQPFRILERL